MRQAKFMNIKPLVCKEDTEITNISFRNENE